MKYVMEEFYNVMEAITITFFVAMYFKIKPNASMMKGCICSFSLILIGNTLTTIFKPSLFVTLFLVVILITTVLERFFQGNIWEHIFISIISFLLIILVDVSVFTALSNAFNVKYRELVEKDSVLRFLTVLTAKFIYIIISFIIVSIKRKNSMILHKLEYVSVFVNLLVSVSMIIIMRNIIYISEKNYKSFLLIVLCLLFINVGQYYTMIYISKKNIAEQKLSLARLQLEIQDANIHNLEKKYDETAKLRHDIKNHLSCSLEMAENGDIDELIKYLRSITDTRIYTNTNYYFAKRKLIGAVINSKFGEAENKGIKINCVIANEMESISDGDIGIMLANLLDNAIEACEKNKNGSSIFLKMWDNAGYYCLELSNTVETDVFLNNPNLETIKADKTIHGMGLKTVKDIVDKYDGMIDFEQRSNNFFVFISLKKQNI